MYVDGVVRYDGGFDRLDFWTVRWIGLEEYDVLDEVGQMR